MIPRDIQVYDAYPDAIADLDAWAAQVDRFPLDELLTVNARVRLTGKHVRAGQVIPMSQKRVDTHAGLIKAAQALRDARAELMRLAAEQRAAQQPAGGEAR